MKTALIIGIKGQDGTLLQEYLKHLSYRVSGVDRQYVSPEMLLPASAADITVKQDVESLLSHLKPDEIYYFAAYHHSSEDARPDDFELYHQSHKVHVEGLLNFLESIKVHSPDTRLFYTSSSLIFGATETDIQNETTPACPDTIYAITKFAAQQLCRYYRENHAVFASVGIMYNHESHLRTDNFLFKKIVKTAVQIQRKEKDSLIVGDLSAEVDWGYAPDYIEAMHRVLQLSASGEFIISSGAKHSVRELAEKVFACIGLDYTQYVIEDRSILTRKKNKLFGDNRKIRAYTGWKPSTSFDEMIDILVDKECLRQGSMQSE
jgi:GDPmannose 4,6-dehydratase